MNELIQKIIDGEHTIQETDFITYPQLGDNIDVMEIAVDENPNFIKYATIEYKRNYLSNERIDKSTIDIYEYALKQGYIPKGIDFEKNPTLKRQPCVKEKVEKEINDTIQKLQNANYVISEEEVLNYSLIIENVLPDYKEVFFSLVLKQNHRFIKFFNVYRYARDYTVDERIISKIIQDGYIPLEEDFINNKNLGRLYNMMDKAIEINPNYIKYILLMESDTSKIGLNYFRNIELFEKALSQGFIPQEIDLMNNTFLTSSKLIMKKAVDMNASYLKYTRVYDDELIDLAMQKGYILTEEDIKNNSFLASSKLIMKKAIDMNTSYLKYTRIYDDELIDLAMQKGYILTEEDIKNNYKLLTSNILMKKAIDIDYRYILICNKDFGTSSEKISADTIKYAISKGYFPSKDDVYTNYKWRKNNDIMMVLIEANPNLVELSYDYETLFDFAVANGYNPSFIGIRDNKKLLESSKLGSYLLKNDIMLYNNGFLNEYIKRDIVKGITLEFIDQIWDFINNNIAYENMDYNEMFTIVKYVYGENSYEERYNKLREQLNELIKNKQFNIFNEIINILLDNNNHNTKDKLNLMNDIIDDFNTYYNLCCSFVSSNYTKKDIYLLQYLLLSNDIIKPNIESIEDLKKYNEVVYQNRKSEINDIPFDWAIGEYEPYFFHDAIILMLFNMSYDEYMKKVHNGFSSRDIDVLINSINNRDIQEDLNRYKIVIKFIESIINVKDGKKLKNFAHRLNEAIYENSESVIDIYNILRDIESIKKYYYDIEISEKLLDISELEPTSEEVLANEKEKKRQPYIRENKKYTCPNVEIHGRKLNNELVDYIELNGIDFTFFVHVLNAYGTGGTLEDFKRSRLIGKTYICVSPITDNYYFGLAESHDAIDDFIEEFDDIDYDDEELLLDISIENADNVKLIFSNISPEQLAAMGDHDLCSGADDNSLEITTERKEKYAPIRKNVDSLNKKGYCEYVLYREDNKGKVIYPTAILSTENEPSQSEIMAAAYLQVPIIHINNKYLNKDKQNISDSQSTSQLEPQEMLKHKLQEMKNILLKGFKNSEASVISEGRKK